MSVDVEATASYVNASMADRIVIIANPVSGGGRGQRRAELLLAALRARRAEAAVLATTPDQNGTALARDLTPANTRAIAVVGGDGSVADVLQGIDPAIPLGVFPAGTANVWANEAGLPRDAATAADVLLAGHTLSTRLGECGDRLFFLFVGAGFDARVVDRVETKRHSVGGRGGMHHWYGPTLRELFSRNQAALHLSIDGHERGPFAQVLVTRVARYATRIRLPEGPAIEDPRLHVVAVPRRGILAMLRVALRGSYGRLRPGREVETFATDAPIAIRGEASEPVHLDGDIRTRTPVEVRLTNRIVQLIVPAKKSV